MTETKPLVQATELDHVNLHVRDVEASLGFYTGTLGLADYEVLDRGDDGKPSFVALSVGRQTVFLMRRAEYAPPERRQRGLNHVCLRIERTDPDALMAKLRARGVPITGTRGRKDGPAFSVYVEDPDGHGIELEQTWPGVSAAAV